MGGRGGDNWPIAPYPHCPGAARAGWCFVSMVRSSASGGRERWEEGEPARPLARTPLAPMQTTVECVLVDVLCALFYSPAPPCPCVCVRDACASCDAHLAR